MVVTTPEFTIVLEVNGIPKKLRRKWKKFV